METAVQDQARRQARMGRRAVFGGAVLVVALFLFFAFGGHEHEPVCNGKTLSQWAMIRSASVGTVLRHTGGQVEGIVWTETIARSHLANAEAAIRHIGTNGLPFMLDWLVYESPALRPTWKQKAIDWLTKIPMPKKFKAGLRNTSFNAYPEQPPRPMPEDALWCFQVLGSKAGPAIPALTKIALEREHWQASVGGIEALDAIGQESTPALLDLATNYACSSRRQVIVALTELAKRNPGSEIGAISRTLARCVNDGDIAIERQAARSLGDLKVDQTIAFPVLTNGLRDPNLAYACLGALGEYGPAAQPALPSLLPLLKSPDPELRAAVSNAAVRINPAAFRSEPE